MIAIWGAGPAGASAAIAARRYGVPVRWIERVRSPGFKAGESLAPTARTLLRRLGVWEGFLTDGHRTCVGNASAWGRDDLAYTDFLFGVHGAGWHLDRQRFDQRLREAALAAGAEWAEDAGAARWHIDCTGRANVYARRRGARRLVLDTLLSHVGVMEEEVLEGESTESTTLVEAGPDGWWYTAPIPGGRRVVAYQTLAGSESDAQARSRDGFSALLEGTQHVRERVTGPWLLGPTVQPANTSRLDRFAGDDWVAAGDAAYALDPLSSHGIVHALQSGWAAGQAMAARSTGDDSWLQAYENRLAEEFTIYLRMRASLYASELRWPEKSFWRKMPLQFDAGNGRIFATLIP
ncbi:MAG: tryptophan 7-halogenase [Bryobacteraceae bacterium]|nr:tryptophan 7-halogenase [Bryobacteraceae bacterium]